MKPKTPMNKWIVDKITNFLKVKEGCEVTWEYTDSGMTIEIQDAFGYKYEAKIKTIGRVNESTANMASYQAVSKD